jgi:hypothetical protein
VKRSGSSVGWNARSTYWHLTCHIRKPALWQRIQRSDGSILRRARSGMSILYDNSKIAVARILGDAAAHAGVQRATITLSVPGSVRSTWQGQ